MNRATGNAGAKPRTAAPLLALSSRGDLPPRVLHLLEGVLGLCSTSLERVLVATLDDFEAQLFKRAEQLRGGELQYRCFETLREIKRGRADIGPRFMLALEDALARFNSPNTSAAPTGPTPNPPKELTLVHTGELEESLALQEFSTRAEIRQAQALFALGHRFAVLAATPIIDAEHLPIGPARFADALRHACACIEISMEHRVWLYHAFDRTSAEALNELYTAINRYFVEHRILSHLHLLVAPRPKDAAVDHRHPAAHAPAPVAEGASNLGLIPDSGARERAVTNYSHTSAAAIPATSAGGNDARDTEFFGMMRELLSGRHPAVPGARTTDSYVPNEGEVQAVLGALQAQPISPMLKDGKLAQRSVGVLKQELLAHLRQVAPSGQTPRLSDEDSDTIDLVGMLFDYLTSHSRPHGSTQSLMTKLQVPLLRVALRDKTFFTRRAHPARQLLNTIAETGNFWLAEPDGATDRGLVDKMQLVVDRVTQDFDGNLALIEDMVGELTQHMHTLTRKAEVAERRHVDAARGREKLSLAREQARNAIASRVAAARPSKLVRTLLEQAWTDVLALTLLRQGEQSEAYAHRLAVADKLLETNASRSGDAKIPGALREDIATALDQVGYHRDDIQTIVKRLFEPEHAHGEDPSSSTEIAIKLKNKPHLGDDAAASTPHKSAHGHKDFPAGSVEASMLERLKSLPFGTWFELIINQQGERSRRKLAWYSTVTGHALFVNQRGVRAEEKSLQQLAQDLVHEQAFIIEPDQESLVDRAWKSIMASLRQLIGRDAAQKPA